MTQAGGLTRQDPDWAIANFYQKLVDHGYNHHMSSGFLPVLPLAAQWDGQPVLDGECHSVCSNPRLFFFFFFLSPKSVM